MRVHYPKRGRSTIPLIRLRVGGRTSDAAKLSPEGGRGYLPAKRKMLVVPNQSIGRGKQDSPHGLQYRDHGKLRTVPFSTKDSIITFL